MRLEIVLGESVRPHEIHDPGRERRIEERLREDGVLRDPLMVGTVQDQDGFVLLDGTNRQRALSTLGLPYLLAQVVEYGDEHAVELRTWCHDSHGPVTEILSGASSIPDVIVRPVAQLGVPDILREPLTLAVVLNGEEQHALIRLPTATSSTEQLRRLVDLYEGHLTRVDCRPDEVEQHAQSYDENRTLIAFPGFSRSQVVTMAMRGAFIPAGITRHIILAGRALRVNLPLDLLSGSLDLPEANAALRSHLSRLQPRVYREPTVLFDS